MLEEYFGKPRTVDRVRDCWIGREIERYVDWLAERGYQPASMRSRVPLLVGFGEFARARGAETVADLPAQVEPFVAGRVQRFARARAGQATATLAKEIRGPVEQMLAVVLPGFERSGRRRRSLPFAEVVPGYFEYLADERGLRPAAIDGHRYHLDRFEA